MTYFDTCQVCLRPKPRTTALRCKACGPLASAQKVMERLKQAVPHDESLAVTHPAIAAMFLPSSAYGPGEVRATSGMQIHVACRDCGALRKTTPKAAVQGQLCPPCAQQYREGGLSSHIEDEVFSFVDAIASGGVRNRRKAIGIELDVHLEELRLALEINGEYWHSNEMKSGNAEAYHRDKLARCKARGIRLAFVWEDDWKHDRVATEHAVEEFIASRGEVCAPLLQRLTSNLDGEE